MRLISGTSLLLVVALTTARGDDIKSGPTGRIGGAFDVKAFSGASKGKQLCYV